MMKKIEGGQTQKMEMLNLMIRLKISSMRTLVMMELSMNRLKILKNQRITMICLMTKAQEKRKMRKKKKRNLTQAIK